MWSQQGNSIQGVIGYIPCTRLLWQACQWTAVRHWGGVLWDVLAKLSPKDPDAVSLLFSHALTRLNFSLPRYGGCNVLLMLAAISGYHRFSWSPHPLLRPPYVNSIGVCLHGDFSSWVLCHLCLPLRSAHENTEPFCIHCSPRANSLWSIAAAPAQRKEVWHRSHRAVWVIDPSQESQLC